MELQKKNAIINTTRFGSIVIAEKKIITMINGLYGFVDAQKFIIVEHEESQPFKWLQSLEKPDLAFVIVDPSNFIPNYKVSLNEEDKSDIHLDSNDNITIYVFVAIPGDPSKATANLLGPIVINTNKMLAKQIILSDNQYSTRQQIFMSN